MWRLMNMTFYGKSRVAPEVAAHIHESPRVDDRSADVLAVGSILAGWLGMPKLWTASARASAASSTGWSRSSPRPRVEAAKEGAHRRLHSSGLLMGTLGRASRSPASCIARYFYHREARDSGFASEPSFTPAARAALNKWYVDEIYDFLFVNGLCKGGGTAARRVRPQRGGRRRERRGLAHALHLDSSRSGGTPGSSTARCASARSS